MAKHPTNEVVIGSSEKSEFKTYVLLEYISDMNAAHPKNKTAVGSPTGMRQTKEVTAGWKNRLRGTLLFVAGFVSAGVLMFMCNWHPALFPVYKGRSLATPPSATDMNVTHIAGKLMEPVAINNIADNIYFTVRTSSANYRKRLLILMLTWLQTVNKDKVPKVV